MLNQAGQFSDDVLAARARDGDDDAFGELMARYRKPLLNFVYRLLGDAAEAEDVAQEAFIRAYRHRADYRSGRKVSTWLFAIARNAAIDRLRYRQRHPVEPLTDVVKAGSDLDPSAEAEVREIGAQIAAAVAELPEVQRTAVVLAEYHNLSTTEIAAIMKCSEKAVESRLYRARTTLRSRLNRWLH